MLEFEKYTQGRAGKRNENPGWLRKMVLSRVYSFKGKQIRSMTGIINSKSYTHHLVF